MANMFEFYPDVPKPRKPSPLDRKKTSFVISASENQDIARDFNTKVSYLMEMMKFFPDYERKLYAGDSQAEVEAAEAQYAEPQYDANHNLIPQFGNVVRSTNSLGQIRGIGQGYDIDGP